jgi:hypothetical protein
MKIRKILAIYGCVFLILCMGSYAQAGPADVDANDAYWWWGDPAGTSRIVRTDSGISGNISVHLGNESGSAKGLAITLWLVIFNNPGECAVPYACSDPDFANPDVMIDVVYGGGNVVGASEKATIGFHYKAGENSGSIADLFGLFTDEDGNSFGLIYPRAAEVHYVIRFHGPVDPAEMPDQIQSYGGGCVAFAPYGWPFPSNSGDLYLGPGDCQDVIFAINPPPM